MIELLLVAEQLIDEGAYDRAELLFTQVSQADPRNAIAVVGLARVALARGDHEKAFDEARRALAIDPEEVAAQRLIDALIDEASQPEVAEELAEEPGQDLASVPTATWSEDSAAAAAALVEAAAEEARNQAEAAGQARAQAAAAAEARDQAAAVAEARAQAWALAQAGAAEARAQAIAKAHVAAAAARAEATAVVQAAAEAQATAASRHVPPEPASAPPERRSLLARLLGLFGIRR